MTEEISSNKRIAKNTMLLYMRMIFMTFIGLFTTRVILNALGVSDLGLMNVAGSVVGMFMFANSTLASGTQRFITFGIGKGNKKELKQIFSCAMTLHLIFAIITLIIGETVGLWYVCNKLVIDEGRFEAAMWCYQLSILSSFIYVIQVPFNSALIAHEHMGMYAYMSIFDAVTKLLAAYLIMVVPFDRVIFYSVLTFIATLIPTFIYNWYCRKHFEECGFHFGYNKKNFKEMVSFSGWNIIGCIADMGQGAGVNLVINSFCGTVVNGSRSIAFQANGWITKFVNNFLLSVNPQIVKSFASGDNKRMFSLVCSGAKYGCYLFLFIGIPLFIEIEWVLTLWLGNCPEHTVVFLRIVMIETLFKTIGGPTINAIHATGKMKAVNISVGLLLLMIVPVSYMLFKLGCTPEVVVMANVIPWSVAPLIRIFLLKKYTNGEISIIKFICETYVKTISLAVIMFIPPYFVFSQTSTLNGFLQFLCVGTTSVVASTFFIYYLGINKNMRQVLKAKIHKIIIEKCTIYISHKS